MGRALGIAPHNAAGHAATCDRVRPFQLPAYYDRADGRCFHCGNVLMWQLTDHHAREKARLGWRYWVYGYAMWNAAVARWRMFWSRSGE
jgi:hypothetical protein